MNLSLDRERAPTTIVMVISILLLLASLGLILWPAKTDNERTQYESNLKKTDDSTRLATKEGDAAQEIVASQTWPGISGQISSIVTLVNQIAAKHNVSVTAIRPQHAVDDGNLTQIPYAINADGAYKDMMAFERDLESPSNRLAVELFQVGSADENSDKVTATLTVMAYVVDASSTTAAGTTTTTTTTKITVAPKKSGATMKKAKK